MLREDMVVWSKRSDPMRSAFIEGILGMGFVLVVALTVVIVLRSFTNKLLEVQQPPADSANPAEK